jgi:hypothetical protein
LPSRHHLGLGRGVVDAQQRRGGAAQVAAQSRFGLEVIDEFVASPWCPAIRAGDQSLEVGDEVGADLLVTLGLVGVVTYHEPLGAGPVVAGAAGGDVDLSDAQVAGHGGIPVGAGRRGGGLGVGMARLLGVDVVPAAPGQIRPIRRTGEPAIGYPRQPA